MRESDCVLILQKSTSALTTTEVEHQYDTHFLSKLEMCILWVCQIVL